MQYPMVLELQRGLSYICTYEQSYIIISMLLPHVVFSLTIVYLCSTRVSNELGAGKPKPARLVASTGMVLAALEGIIVGAVLFASRRVFGLVFTNNKEVVDHVTTMAPLVCVSAILDSLQGTLSG